MTAPRDGLRPVRDGDAAALEALIRRCWDDYPGCVLDVDAEEPWLRAPASAQAAVHGALWVLDGGPDTAGLVASVAVRHVPGAGEAELKTLYVWPTGRRQGLGAALLHHAERYASDRGATSMMLWSDTRFEAAHRLYERHGYRRFAGRSLADLSHSREHGFRRRLTR